MNNAKQEKTATSTDSIFGMALGQAFMGAAFGLSVDMAWEACEVADAVYTDRCAKNDAKPAPKFDMGKQKSLGGFFDLTAANTDREPMPMRPIIAEGYTSRSSKPSSFGFSMAA